MKKINILMLLIGCIVITSCIRQNDKINQWKEYELKGEVRSLKISEYTAIERFGEITKDSLIYNKIVYFNQKGLVDSITYYKDYYDTLRFTEIYNWDFTNNTCTITIKEDPSFYYVLQYNDLFNRLLSEVNYKNDSISGKQTKSYNELLQLIDLIVYRENGDIWWREKDHEYNDDGKLIHYSRYNEKGELDYTYSYRYDDNGNLIGMKWGKNKYTYEYNAENMLCREIQEYKSKYYSSTNITEYTYQLDDKGNYLVKTKKSYDKDDSNNNIVYEYTEREITYY